MKVSFVSSQAISQAIRYQMSRMQADLVVAQKEVATLRVADVGLALGARTGVSVSLYREIDRLKGITDTNQLAASRLDSTQIGMRQLRESASDLIATLTTAVSGASDPAIVKQQADQVLGQMTSVLNANLNGEHLFAGINTDVQPFNDFLDPTSPNRVAFDNAFTTHFGFPAGDPAAAAITEAEMNDFLDNVADPLFFGAGWADWSNATDQQITSRITLTETAQTSVSANIPGFRKLAMAAAIVSAAFDDSMSQAGRSAILARGLDLLGSAVNDLANQEGSTGITQQRIEKANERMSMQIDIFTTSLLDLEGVDGYEASTKVTGLLAQIEISYSLTARMQQLSLLRYL
ncbi:flagellar hook-associated family protein [Mesorhizobium microcysteis]|jgi:flagellar hook-associated protein 3 FlgL|uniref:Flagellin n=1 Tax=Neoaquamicrobium microcysteis TaxID=2682781 RepID=A0A5D4GPA6_9HYPH|nr:flagellar hook-associated family protein [Mesorhizobium microcysteis]TYR30138.1 flagellar hook-associated family protein [Mesorhizobium microcysteis]